MQMSAALNEQHVSLNEHFLHGTNSMRLEREIDYLMVRLTSPGSSVNAIRSSLKQMIGLKVQMSLGQAMLIEQLVDAIFEHYQNDRMDRFQLGRLLKAKLPAFVFTKQVEVRRMSWS
jgi:hypothetical protein